MKINHQKRNAKSIDNSGFNSESQPAGKRLVNKDGTNNIRKTGLDVFKRFSIYHSLLKMPGSTFLLLVFSFYTIINILFAFVYLFVGIENLEGVKVSSHLINNFTQAFFFSSQTMTTVGYGHIAPSGFVANAVASIESFLGIITFALVTGMFYARFSRPNAYIKFSENALVAPFKAGKAIMFRIATYKSNHLTEVNAEVTAVIHVNENGKFVSKFYPLSLEINRINSLAISWTCVHNINEDSPFWQMTKQDFFDSKVEMLVTIKGFDDHYSNTVQQRTSYNHDEFIYGAKFDLMFYKSTKDQITEVDLNLVNLHHEHLFDDDIEIAEINHLQRMN